MYEEVLLEAFELEDVVKCRQLNDYSPRLPTRNPLKKAVWFYKCAIRGIWHRVRHRCMRVVHLTWYGTRLTASDRVRHRCTLGVESGRHKSTAPSPRKCRHAGSLMVIHIHRVLGLPDACCCVVVLCCGLKYLTARTPLLCTPQVLAVVLGCLSVLIVWAEATIWTRTDLSPLSLLIKDTRNSEFVVQVITLLPLVRMRARYH